ncbi:regulator of G-protein signaling 21-like isoform X1 [Callorhinchus milii]|uniref:regulator of G-protein signaling 21-like isoform X1 n=1 Tax=Callorhinchus milii TaxID=7868 RepID=UPI001C3F7B2E|nr:regulator of G-protein signaling 21-like isoform X1 [Callorhinchus milii]
MQSVLILLLHQKHSPMEEKEYCNYQKQDEKPTDIKKHKFIKDLKSRCSYFLHHPASFGDSSSLLSAKADGVKVALKPTHEEVMTWAESLDNLLAHKYGLIAFRAFLKSEYNEENIEFWLACEDYKKIKSSMKLASKAKKIYAEFIEPTSPKEINLDYYTKELIASNIQQPTYSCFDVAQNKVYGLMENNCYTRFLQSDIYKNLLNSSLDNHQT